MGRTTERQELDDLLESAHGGQCGRLLLLGDPGMGTTTLLRWLGGRAREDGYTVVALDGRHLAGDAEPDVPAHSLTIVIVDDLHRAGPGSIGRLLERLSAADRCALLVAATHPVCVPEDLPGEWDQLLLGPLDLQESVELLRSTYDSGIDQAVCLALASAVAGNPLALVEVAGALTDDERGGRTSLPSPLPVTEVMIRAWRDTLARLPTSVTAAAVDLAVCGSDGALLEALAAESGWTETDLMALLDTGLAVRRADGLPAFRHAVIEHVLLASTSPSALKDRHRNAAAIAHELGRPPADVMDHLVAATSLPDADVAARLEEQARRAELLDELLVASSAWRAAARLSPPGPQRTSRARASLRLIVENGMDYEGSLELVDLVAGESLDDEFALWVEWVETLYRAEADPEAGLTAQWNTIRHARTAAPETLRELLIDTAMNAWVLGVPADGLAAAREYLAVEREFGDVGVEPPWTGALLLSAALFQAGDVAASTPLRAAAIEAASAADPTTMVFDRLLTTVYLDDVILDTSPAAADRLLLAAQRADPRTACLACIYGIRAWRYRAAGKWDRAHDMLARGRPLAATMGAAAPQLGMAVLACELASLEGGDDVLAREGMAARIAAVRAGDRRRLAIVDRAFGMKALAAGRLEEAVANLSAAADVGFLGRGLRDAVIPSRVDLVEVHLRLGDRPEAERRADAVSSILRAMDVPLARALDLRIRGLVDDDLEQLRVSTEVHEEAGDPFEEARTRLLLAERLRRAHQRVEARTQLMAAERLFAMLGARPWLNRTRTELRAVGSDRPHGPGLASLTPQEAAVAQAVAAGRSNREVAAELFLSQRTVEYHLGSVYRKLGVRGRTALARLLADSESGDAAR